MRRFLIATTLVIAWPVAAGSIGCGSAFSAGSPVTDGGTQGDVTTQDVSSGDAQPASDGSTDGGADAKANETVYVSINGKDSNSGLDPTLPKKTIASALLVAASLPGVPTVEVCGASSTPAGTAYSESVLAIGKDVALLGGWDCGFQTRNPSMYPTVINNGSVASPGATLLVTPIGDNGITSKTVIDGFGINGAASGGSMSSGVNVTGNASPVLSNDAIVGGGGTAGTTDQWGSIGVRAGMGAAPEIKNCIIGGGTGSGPNGSAGIVVEQGGNPNIHEDVVSGGSGTGTAGLASAGIVLSSALQLANPIVGLLVYGNNAAEPSSGGIPTPASAPTDGIAIEVGTGATIESSVILGGVSTVATHGVDVHSGGTVVLEADRIYGGGGAAKATGVLVVQTNGQLTIVNSEIHAGTSTAAGSSVGVDLSGTTAPLVLDDTIYAGPGTGTAIALSGNAPDGGVGGVTGAVIHNDLLLGSGSESGSNGVVATAPTNASSNAACQNMISDLDYTGFSNFTVTYACMAVTDNSAPSVTALTAGSCVTYGMSCQKDVQIGGCTGNNECLTNSSCPGASSTCLGSIFGSWVNDGRGIFVPPTGDGGTFEDWVVVLQSNLIACGGLGQAGVTTDLVGAQRSTTGPTTIGAVVNPSSTCPQ